MMKYKLIHRDTQETMTTGDDNTVVFGGLWGQRDDQGALYIWVENIIPPPTVDEQAAEIELKYQPKFNTCKERLITVMAADGINRPDKILEVQNQYNSLADQIDLELIGLYGGNE